MVRFTFSENDGKTRFMGIINISSDSFYEPGSFRCPIRGPSQLTDTDGRYRRRYDDRPGAEPCRPGSSPRDCDQRTSGSALVF